MSISPSLRFSDTNSFRLFTEGVQALQSFERTAKKEALQTAAERFHECVSNYRDVLPRLYLGIVRTYQGEAFDEAVALLQDVLNRNIPELSATAKYYMAEALVSAYGAQQIAQADELLEQVISDRAASLADHLRAEGLRTFNYVRQNLWRKRATLDDLASEEREAARRMEDFKTHLNGAEVPEDLKASLSADYWNVEGLLNEFRATRVPEGPARKPLIETSLAAFEGAVTYGANRADAKSNQARVQFDLAHDAEAATRLCYEVLELRENDSFAYLLLGRMSESNRPADAVGYYEKAEAKYKEAALGAGRSYEKLDKLNEAIAAFASVPTSDRRFGEASFYIGALYERLHKTDDALKAYALVPASDKEFFEKAEHAIATLKSTPR